MNNKTFSKIEGEFLVIRIPLSELPLGQADIAQKVVEGDVMKGMKGKTRAFIADLLTNYRHNTPINRQDDSLCELAHKHRVTIHVVLKEMEARNMVMVDRMREYPHHIKTFVIL